MAVARLMPPLVLSEDVVQQLQSIANPRSLPHLIVQRAQIGLACGAGETNTAIAMRMGLTGMIVGKWCKRYRHLQKHLPTAGSSPFAAVSAPGISPLLGRLVLTISLIILFLEKVRSIVSLSLSSPDRVACSALMRKC